MGYCGKLFGVRGSALLSKREGEIRNFQLTKHSPSLQKASCSHPCPYFSNCMWNDITSVCLCHTTFRKKQLYSTPTFALFELTPLLWGTCFWKWKVIYLECCKSFNQTLSMYVFLCSCLQYTYLSLCCQSHDIFIWFFLLFWSADLGTSLSTFLHLSIHSRFAKQLRTGKNKTCFEQVFRIQYLWYVAM